MSSLTADIRPADGGTQAVRSGSPELRRVIEDIGRSAAASKREGGTSAIKQSENLDRHWRNIRTLASHNPAAYKARAVGDHFANGERLPTNGFF